MKLLAIETSTDFGSCALLLDGRMNQRVCPAGRPHSETLLPLVRELMAEAGLSFRSLDGIAFGAGPGAFTGLRVACGIAQGLAVAADLPVVPVSGLEAMAATVGEPRVLSLLDARMGEVYGGAYERHGEVFALTGAITLTAPEALEFPGTAAWIACGNAIDAYPLLAGRLRDGGLQIRSGVLPQADALARLGAVRLQRGEGIDPALAAPLYVRNKVAKTIGERLAEGGRA